MDIRDFYLQNVKTNEYHYRFMDSVKNVNKVYNITKFVSPVRPGRTFPRKLIQRSAVSFLYRIA